PGPVVVVPPKAPALVVLPPVCDILTSQPASRIHNIPINIGRKRRCLLSSVNNELCMSYLLLQPLLLWFLNKVVLIDQGTACPLRTGRQLRMRIFCMIAPYSRYGRRGDKRIQRGKNQ